MYPTRSRATELDFSCRMQSPPSEKGVRRHFPKRPSLLSPRNTLSRALSRSERHPCGDDAAEKRAEGKTALRSAGRFFDPFVLPRGGIGGSHLIDGHQGIPEIYKWNRSFCGLGGGHAGRGYCGRGLNRRDRGRMARGPRGNRRLAGWMRGRVARGLGGSRRPARWNRGRLAGWVRGRLTGRLAGWHRGSGWVRGRLPGRLAGRHRGRLT